MKTSQNARITRFMNDSPIGMSLRHDADLRKDRVSTSYPQPRNTLRIQRFNGLLTTIFEPRLPFPSIGHRFVVSGGDEPTAFRSQFSNRSKTT